MTVGIEHELVLVAEIWATPKASRNNVNTQGNLKFAIQKTCEDFQLAQQDSEAFAPQSCGCT